MTMFSSFQTNSVLPLKSFDVATKVPSHSCSALEDEIQNGFEINARSTVTDGDLATWCKVVLVPRAKPISRGPQANACLACPVAPPLDLISIAPVRPDLEKLLPLLPGVSLEGRNCFPSFKLTEVPSFEAP